MVSTIGRDRLGGDSALGDPLDLDSPLRVLVVDDEELLVRSCARILEHEGLVVETATRGNIALELLSRFHPEIVLVDLMLPDIGGLELLAEIHEHDPDILVIMITGHATVESSVAAIRAGATITYRNLLRRCSSRSSSGALRDRS